MTAKKRRWWRFFRTPGYGFVMGALWVLLAALLTGGLAGARPYQRDFTLCALRLRITAVVGVLTGPLTVTAYAGLRARGEPLPTAMLAEQLMLR